MREHRNFMQWLLGKSEYELDAITDGHRNSLYMLVGFILIATLTGFIGVYLSVSVASVLVAFLAASIYAAMVIGLEKTLFDKGSGTIIGLGTRFVLILVISAFTSYFWGMKLSDSYIVRHIRQDNEQVNTQRKLEKITSIRREYEAKIMEE